MNFTKILTFAIIVMFLVTPFAGAKQEVADSVKQDKINEKVTGKTKESAKEISNKGKDIKGKVTVTDSDSSKYTVEKKSKTEISISKSEAKGEHTKSKVTFAKEDLQKIDIDGDQLYGVLHIADDGTTTHDIVTESELVAGTEMTFSENIVNGYTGYYEKTQVGVTSGTTIDIPDVSGTDYYITVAVNGTVPTYTAINTTNKNTFPRSGNMIAGYNFNNGATDISGNGITGTPSNISYVTDAGKTAASFNGVSSSIDFGTSAKLSVSRNLTLIADIKRTSATYKGTIVQYGRYQNEGGYNWYVDSAAPYSTNMLLAGVSTWQSPQAGNAQIPAAWSTVAYNFSGGAWSQQKSGKVMTTGTATNSSIFSTTRSMVVGKTNGGTAYFNGLINYLYVYNASLTQNEINVVYTGGSGISVQPEPSYNFTGYNVASGVEKIIDTDATCTGLEYIDTTGGTHTVTVRIYFTEDITKTTETKGAVYQNVSIIHTKQNATASTGSIAYELDPLYSGTPILTSNNTNATVSRNDTHAIISTGLVKQGQSFSYAVSVPDNHDHVIFLNQLMQWMGSGWDYVGVAPEDWVNYIGDQIEVTVS